jgi:hypothetical protein
MRNSGIRIGWVVMGVWLMLLMVCNGFSAVHCVWDGATGTGTGDDKANAFTTIQAAVDHAGSESPNTIYVYNGTYPAFVLDTDNNGKNYVLTGESKANTIITTAGKYAVSVATDTKSSNLSMSYFTIISQDPVGGRTVYLRYNEGTFVFDNCIIGSTAETVPSVGLISSETAAKARVLTVTNCTFPKASVAINIVSGGAITITGNNITSTGDYNVVQIAGAVGNIVTGGNTISMTGNKAGISLGNDGGAITGGNSVTMTGDIITSTNAAGIGIFVARLTSSAVAITGVNVTSVFRGICLGSGISNATITGCTISNSPATTGVRKHAICDDATYVLDAPYINITNNTLSGTESGVELQACATNLGTYNVTNNQITCTGGDESIQLGFNDVITTNPIGFANISDNDISITATATGHAVLVGSNVLSGVVKNNKVIKTGTSDLGLVIKDANYVDVYDNYIQSPQSAFMLKGAKYCTVYNNTFVGNAGGSNCLFDICENATVTPTNNKVYNNIFWSTVAVNYTIYNSTDGSINVLAPYDNYIDYNIYKTGTVSFMHVAGTDPVSLTEMKAYWLAWTPTTYPFTKYNDAHSLADVSLGLDLNTGYSSTYPNYGRQNPNRTGGKAAVYGPGVY